MFFIHKDKIGEFQDRCVIALFLDYHRDVIFVEYLGPFHFRGIFDHLEQDIYIFNVPKRNNLEMDKGVVFKYRGRNSGRAFTYVRISEKFVEEYVQFKENPYHYLCKNFGEKQWERTYPLLIKSDDVWGIVKEYDKIESGKESRYSEPNPEENRVIERSEEKNYFKYKPDPVNCNQALYDKYVKDPTLDEVKDLGYFLSALEGTLAFTKPEWLNDPFDSDCLIPIKSHFPSLLKSAISGTKYRGAGSVEELGEGKIESWWNDIPDEDKQRIIDAFERAADRIADKNIEDLDVQLSIIPDYLTGTIVDALRGLFAETRKGISDKQMLTIVFVFAKIRYNMINIKNEFRILSLAKSPFKILMWGYYCNSGKGICLEHKMESIHNAIETSADVAKYKATICIYGNIKYSEDRPKYDPVVGKRIDNMLEYIVKCVFTKFMDWSHEDEFRYVLMGGDVVDSKAICVGSDLEKCYFGVKKDEVELYKILDKNGAWPAHNRVQIKKHHSEYRFVEK